MLETVTTCLMSNSLIAIEKAKLPSGVEKLPKFETQLLFFLGNFSGTSTMYQNWMPRSLSVTHTIILN